MEFQQCQLVQHQLLKQHHTAFQQQQPPLPFVLQPGNSDNAAYDSQWPALPSVNTVNMPLACPPQTASSGHPLGGKSSSFQQQETAGTIGPLLSGHPSGPAGSGGCLLDRNSYKIVEQ